MNILVEGWGGGGGGGGEPHTRGGPISEIF